MSVKTVKHAEENKNLSGILYTVLSENSNDIKSVENRWRGTFNSIFTSLAQLVVRFFVSQVKSDEVIQVQSFIQQFFRRTDYSEKIKNDSNLQNVFLLGYCHAVDEMMDNFEEAISIRQNDSLKSVVGTYKYVKPVIQILDQEFEISHKDLAEQIGISESALSNFMGKVQKYNLFNSVRVGKKRYYSLAHPNGEEVLKIIKEDSRPSVDSYTEFLLKLLRALCDIGQYDYEPSAEETLKKCINIVTQYTTKPALCKQQINDLAYILRGERISYGLLGVVESTTLVAKSVTIFTRDINSEKSLKETIKKNLERNIRYQWFLVVSDEIDSQEKAKSFFYKQLQLENIDLDKNVIEKRICFHILSTEEMDSLLEDIFDAVIYDGREGSGYSCKDCTISDATPYFKMEDEVFTRLNSYIEEHGDDDVYSNVG